MKEEIGVLGSRNPSCTAPLTAGVRALARVGAILRRQLQPYVPTHFKDPIGLAMRLIRTREPAALYSMQLALMGALLSPLDLLLQESERRLYSEASEPKLPLIFVCGPPRSGTTLVTQVLIKNLPVSYLNNLTAVFPRSPIAGTLLLEDAVSKKESEFKSFYGRTVGLDGHNDALQLWDRWFGSDRRRIPTALTDGQKDAMLRFFGAHEAAFGKPLVVKNNALNTCAHLVAGALKNAHFICLTREPAYLAQSLLKARTDLHGDLRTWYGVEDSDRRTQNHGDVIRDVCEQVLFHERRIREQQRIIGEEKFRIISYEQFCGRPYELVKEVSEGILSVPVAADLESRLSAFKTSNRLKVEPEMFQRIEQTFLLLKGCRSGFGGRSGVSNYAEWGR